MKLNQKQMAHDLWQKKETNEDKQKVSIYINKIQKLLTSKEGQKKAASIIEEMLRNKKKS